MRRYNTAKGCDVYQMLHPLDKYGSACLTPSRYDKKKIVRA